MSYTLAHYKKKPKDILILDCVYLNEQRDLVEKERRRIEKEYTECNDRLRVALAKVQCLVSVNEKLADSLKQVTSAINMRSL